MTDEDKPRPLLKEIAVPGVYQDMTGLEVDLDKATLSRAVEGSQTLMERGFRVLAYSSHDTNDSRDVLGRWDALYLDDRGHLLGVFQPLTDDARRLALELDSSLVLEEDVPLANGEAVAEAITRVDVVGQGAVVGTAPVRSRQQPLGARRRVLLARGEDAMPADDIEKKPAPSTLARALARTVGLSDDSTVEDIEAHLLETLELVNMAEDDRAEALAARLARAFGAEDVVADEVEDIEDIEDIEAEEAPVEAARFAQLQAQVAQLQADKVGALFSRPLPKAEAQAIRAQFERLQDVAGFELAYETARSQVALLSRVTAPGASRPTRIAERPQAPKTDDDKRKAFARRLAKAAVAMGHKQRDQG